MLVLWFDRNRPEALLGECRAYYEQRGIAFRLHGEGLPELAEGETLLAFGGRALEALKKAGLLPKNRALGSLRGKAHAYPPDAKLFLTYDPQIIAVDYARKADIYWDLQLAARADRTGTTQPVLGEYRYVPDFSEALAEIARRFKATGRPVPVTLDLETVGTDHVDPGAGIVSVALTVSAGRSDMVRFTPPSLSADSAPTALIGQLQTLATDIRRVRVRGANFKFDQLWMWAKWGIEAWPTFVFDTTLVGSLLDENRSNSLSLHAKLFTDLGGYDDALNARYDKSRMDLVPDDDLLVYGGGDTDATYRTSEVFARALVRDKKLTGFYQHLLHRAAQAVMVMERRGIVVDRERYAQVEAEVQGVKEAAEQRALAMLPGRLRAKYLDNLSLTRSRLVCDFMFSSLGLSLRPQLFTPKDDSPSTSLAHLEAVAQGHAEAEQFVAAMREWQQAQKTHSTYITGFLKHLRADGRYHPSYMLYRGTFGDSDDVSGAVTGRTACKEPAYQCQPARSLVLTRFGYMPLGDLVASVRRGARPEVLTHSGEWKPVIGTHDNGERPLFRIVTESGRVLECTGNHPVLTPEGFCAVQCLNISDKVISHAAVPESRWASFRKAACSASGGTIKPGSVGVPVPVWKYESSSCGQSEIRKHLHLRLCLGGGQAETRPLSRWQSGSVWDDQNLPFLGRHENTLPESKLGWLQILWRSGHQSLRALAGVREFLSRHGGDTSGVLNRAQGRERKLRAEQLPVDSESATEFEQAQFQDKIIRIDILPAEPTFGITIKDSHSYVSDGVVVHNTMPKHTRWAKLLRTVYTPPPGHAILKADYSQGELRVVACVANEKVMLDTYRRGIDLHLKTGAEVYGLTLEQALAMSKSKNPADLSKVARIRQGGKAGNFGLIYEMQAAGFVSYARSTFGVELTMKQGAAFYDRFFAAYPGLKAWHRQSKAFAHEHRAIRSPLGRVRRLPLINSRNSEVRALQERQAINSPIQATLSDMGLFAIAELHARYPELWVFGFTHDDLGAYVPLDEVDLWVGRLREVMENLPLDRLGWHPQLQFPVDVDISETDLASVRKYRQFG